MKSVFSEAIVLAAALRNFFFEIQSFIQGVCKTCDELALFAFMAASKSQQLVDTIHLMFSEPVSICAIDVATIDLSTLPAEVVLRNARAKRQLEFAAGRLAAFAALKDGGYEPGYPGIGDGRQPVWPQGTVGSISHTSELAIAIVASSGHYRAIGIDIELVQQLEPDIASQVATPRELVELRDENDGIDALKVLRLFSFKESVFKCVFPTFGEFIEFTDVEVRTVAGGGMVADCVRAGHPAADLVAGIRGNSRRCGSHVVSACWLPVSA